MTDRVVLNIPDALTIAVEAVAMAMSSLGVNPYTLARSDSICHQTLGRYPIDVMWTVTRRPSGDGFLHTDVEGPMADWWCRLTERSEVPA